MHARPLPGLADERDAAAVQPHDLARDRKAQAGAAGPVAGGGRDAIVLSHARPAVAHSNLDLVRALRHHDVDLVRRRRVPDRVVDEY